MSRRAVLGGACVLVGAVSFSPSRVAARSSDAATIPALLPRDPTGHQFLLYADSTSGRPDKPQVTRHRDVTAMIQRVRPEPEFIAFPGDAVQRGDDPAQWREWQDQEMAWLRGKPYPLFQSTSNHNTLNPESVRLFREVWPDIPRNGPAGQEGLAYYVRRGNLLYVSLHEPLPEDNHSRVWLDGLDWLDGVLRANADAPYKFVVGHYPVFPVNGYRLAPNWCFPEEQRAPLWSLLTRHAVTAYLCSHIIAFDVQVHDGLLQITSGGAGTTFGPGGFMPGSTEYLHAVQIAVDKAGLRYQVLDTSGQVREALSWPPATIVPETSSWSIVTTNLSAYSALQLDLHEKTLGSREPEPFADRVDWLTSKDGRFSLGVDVATSQLTVDLVLDRFGKQRWVGPKLEDWTPVHVQLLFHPAMGPGGMLWRWEDTQPWNSMTSQSAAGLEAFPWPYELNATSGDVVIGSGIVRIDRVTP